MDDSVSYLDNVRNIIADGKYCVLCGKLGCYRSRTTFKMNGMTAGGVVKCHSCRQDYKEVNWCGEVVEKITMKEGGVDLYIV